MQTHTFTEVSHKLSDIKGVYVVTDTGMPMAVCMSLETLRETLEALSYDEAKHVTVSIVPADGGVLEWTCDEITHLIFQDWIDGFDSYAAWSEHHGENGFVEHWFEAWAATDDYRLDYRRRYERHRPAAGKVTRVEPTVDAPALMQAAE